MKGAKALAERWRSESGSDLADEVVARLVAGRSLGGLDLPEYEGRVDLRYLPAPVPRRLERFESQGWFVERLGELVTLRGTHLEHLDLSGAQLQSFRFHDAHIIDCRFDRANCRDWRMWGTSIVRCSFAEANLRGAAVGTWHDRRGNEWHQVDFSGADFRVGVSLAAVYEDCTFDSAKLTSVTFEQCSFKRCRFSGTLSKVVFDGRDLGEVPAPPNMVGVDFSDAHFDRVTFLGCRLDGVLPPADPDVRLLKQYRRILERAVGEIVEDDSRAARVLRSEFEGSLQMMRSGDEDQLVNVRDYQASGEDVAALAIKLLTTASSG